MYWITIYTNMVQASEKKMGQPEIGLLLIYVYI